MKKALIVILTISMMMFLFAGCTSEEVTPDPAPVEEPIDEGRPISYGLGSVSTIGKSTDVQAQVDTTLVAASFNKDGQVVEVQIDVAQVRVAYDEDMNVTTDRTTTIETKQELGDAYGMKARSDIGKEWYEQITAFEEWMVGKTIAEIKGLNVNENVPDVPELTSSVTITVNSYIEAVEKAWNNRTAVLHDTLGLGHTISIAKSTDANDEGVAQAQVDTTLSATVFDAEGKVVGTKIDTAQVRVRYEDGKLVSDKAATILTKQELGDDYGMKARSGIEKEWYEQVNEFAKWMRGQTISEIKGLNLNDNVPDAADLTSSVTITVDTYIDAVEKAWNNRK